MSSPLAELTNALRGFEDEGSVLELAVRALHAECPRGVAMAATTRGARAQGAGELRIMKAGAFVEVPISPEALKRSPAFDVANVPVEQQNRWVEPFRDGIASRESWKNGSVYPFVRRLDIGEQGRIAICNAEVMVAFAAVGIPEGTEFSDDERARLAARAGELVVPLRVCALLANAKTGGSALEELLEARADVVVLTDRRGGILGESRRARALLAREPHLRNAVARAVERAGQGAFLAGGRAFHASPCVDGRDGSAYIVAIDEPSVRTQKKLSARQLELVALVERGLANAEIARAMGIAPATVKTMLERLYKHAGVANRVELVTWSRGR